MAKSKLTTALATITKKIKWPENNQFGYKPAETHNKYYNPLLTPPPRSPRTVDDFKDPSRLGHWRSYGFDYTNPTADKYYYHELAATFVIGTLLALFVYSYGPDYKLRDWARREAYLRTHKREALGLPLIDRNIIDPERMVLPSEEEIDDFPVHF